MEKEFYVLSYQEANEVYIFKLNLEMSQSMKTKPIATRNTCSLSSFLITITTRQTIFKIRLFPKLIYVSFPSSLPLFLSHSPSFSASSFYIDNSIRDCEDYLLNLLERENRSMSFPLFRFLCLKGNAQYCARNPLSQGQ